MKHSVFAALPLLFLFLFTPLAHGQVPERTVTVTVDDLAYEFVISVYSFERRTSIEISESLFEKIIASFGYSRFIFNNQITQHTSDNVNIRLDPRTEPGNRLEVRFVATTLDKVDTVVDIEKLDNVTVSDVQTMPSVVHQGATFRIMATITNETPQTIVFMSLCESPLSASFSDKVEIEHVVACEGFIHVPVNPGETTTVTGPKSGILYRAASQGTVESTITFSYTVREQSFSISKPFTFTIESPEGVSVVTKTNKNTLLSVKNVNEKPIYAVNLSAVGGIDVLKIRGWDVHRLDTRAPTIMLETQDRPIVAGRTLVMLLSQVKDVSVEWKVFDVDRRIISSGLLE